MNNRQPQYRPPARRDLWLYDDDELSEPCHVVMTPRPPSQQWVSRQIHRRRINNDGAMRAIRNEMNFTSFLCSYEFFLKIK